MKKCKFVTTLFPKRRIVEVREPHLDYPFFTWRFYDPDEWTAFKFDGQEFDLHVLAEQEWDNEPISWETSVYPVDPNDLHTITEKQVKTQLIVVEE